MTLLVCHSFERCERNATSRVADVEVGLVTQHHEVVACDELGEARELVRRALGAEGVLQVVRARAGACGA